MRSNLKYLALGFLIGANLLALSAHAAPVSTILGNVIPEATQKYDLGTTTPAAEWKNIYTQNLIVSGTCTGCSTGSPFAWTPTPDGFNSTTTPLRFSGGASTTAFSANTLSVGQTGTTSISATGAVTIGNLTSALTVAGSAGLLEEYAGTSCTNQFPRSLSVLGAATCASVSLTADITGTLPVANGGIGAATLASNSVLTGNGTSAITAETNLTFDGSLLTITGNASTTAVSSTGNALFATGGGLVGIGTTSPYAKLSVGGEVVAANYTATTTATSTFSGGIQLTNFNLTSGTASSTGSNGINLTGGCFAVNGTCVGGGGGGTITGSGASGQVTYWNGATSITGNNNLFWDATNFRLGIGTTTPNLGISASSTAIYSHEKIIPWTSTITINLSSDVSNNYRVILTGNDTTLTFTGGWPGQGVDLKVCQDSTGGRTIKTYTNPILWPGATTTLSETANKCSRLMFKVSTGTSTAATYDVIGAITGY